eukprot:gnl/TRDRNA2_/TRDRNA2_140820_c0_seq1.p1 gnl/TRDRNA2_/TRDRNA2_140820_c0~~gnl/TRDRNA2_/TRDRNA2_140820_c0_seq1.p1  ORF type:complete len:272 (-),score=17.34 gnl/TRDRNA2_/TRDRNA2_140820_c0_seq1:108-824(-)
MTVESWHCHPGEDGKSGLADSHRSWVQSGVFEDRANDMGKTSTHRGWRKPRLGDTMEFWCFYDIQKQQTCLRLVEAAEAARGMRFDWLVRLRPDMRFYTPIGDLHDFDRNAIHVVFNHGEDIDNNFALVPRPLAQAYFDFVGNGCPTEAEMRKAKCDGVANLDGRLFATCECALQARLLRSNAPVRPLPSMDRIELVRMPFCREGGPDYGGNCPQWVNYKMGISSAISDAQHSPFDDH